MKQALNETISALADGELSPDEARFALRRLESDADARQAWSRVHLVRAVLRRDPHALAPASFAHDVLARLEADAPAVRGARPWVRHATGGLIAASVAAAALFAVTPREADAPGLGPTPAGAPTIAVTTPITTEDLRPRIGALPASDSIVTPLRATPALFGDPRLDQYLLQHSDAARTGARDGYVPYVYVVATPARAPRPPERAQPDAR